MDLQTLKKTVYEFALEYGMKPRNPRKEDNSPRICTSSFEDPRGYNSVTRDNTEGDGALYFGFIRPEESANGSYRDLSLVFFPSNDGKICVVSLGIGTDGLDNDMRIATLPGTRRLFMRLRDRGGKTFFKNDFSDTNNPSDDLFKELSDTSLNIDRYKNFLPASEIVDFNTTNDEKGLDRLKSWIATYAIFRDWPNQTKRNQLKKYLPKSDSGGLSCDKIFSVLKKNRFIVLEGAPGTGKTYNALKIASTYFKDKVLFEQFHAETTYSDFVWGIRPKLSVEHIGYESNDGVLLQAIDTAKGTEDDVLLIIDEINRANLSNVLGPVFYLFEKESENRNFELKVGNRTIKALPNNLYVIATMNTADRSLAVVDFALRRRFTWLTLRPHTIEFDSNSEKKFHSEDFESISSIFEKYANDNELNLQPGHSYFITDADSAEEHMKDRLRYELMPLIKEYLNEGYLSEARDEFSNYFYQRIGVNMYE